MMKWCGFRGSKELLEDGCWFGRLLGVDEEICYKGRSEEELESKFRYVVEEYRNTHRNPVVRDYTCSWCKNLCKDGGWTLQQALCLKTKRRGSLFRGKNCKYFEKDPHAERQLRSCLNDRYLERRNQIDKDYRTAPQWKKAHRGVLPGAVGRVLWANLYWMYVYYLPEDTYDLEHPPEHLDFFEN